MALRLKEKQEIVAEVNAVAQNAVSAVIVDYRGISVSAANELRAKARQANVYFRVVRNTLVRRAFEGTSFECLSAHMVGPLALALSKEEPSAAARLLREFAKTEESLEVKGLSIDGQFLPASQLNALAELPTRDEAIAMLMSVMQAPISKFVRTLSEPQAKLVRTLDAVRAQKAG